MKIRFLFAAAVAACATLVCNSAFAFELTELNQTPLRLDITATTVSDYHTDNRNGDRKDDNYGDLFNRLNFLLGYGDWVGQLRLDTAHFVTSSTPLQLAKKDITDTTSETYNDEVLGKARVYEKQLANRYRSELMPSKFSLGYNSANFEVTAGDSYVQFGRGIALSIRKQDELGFDTTLRGGKVVFRNDVFNIMAVAGVTNPTRCDVATGECLYQLKADDEDIAHARPGAILFAPDQVYGARAEVGSDGYTLGAHAVRLIRGSEADSAHFYTTPPAQVTIFATSIVGLTGQMPLPGGSFYVEGDVQQNPANYLQFKRHSYALYSAIDLGAGPVSGVVELQHYRSYDGLYASVNTTRADAFTALRYTAPPNTEPIGIDYRFGSFDRCVTGGRSRVAYRFTPGFSVDGSVGYWATWSERDASCPEDAASKLRNDVVAGDVGVDLIAFGTHLIAHTGLRHDYAIGNAQVDSETEDHLYYGEWFIDSKWMIPIAGRWSTQLNVRERRRVEEFQKGHVEGWNQGEAYLSLRFAPDITASVGLDYTGQQGKSPTYYNVSGSWQYATGSLIKLLAGQMRGDLKCVNGVCRVFPDFEGVKLEWVQRY